MECLRNLPTRNPASFTTSSSGPYSPTHKIEQPDLYIPTNYSSGCQSHQVITTESTSVFVRNFEHMQKAKQLQSPAGKRQIEQHNQLERRSKHPRRQCLFEGNYKDLQEGSYSELEVNRI